MRTVIYASPSTRQGNVYEKFLKPMPEGLRAGFGEPEIILHEGISSTRVYGVARAIQLRARLGREDLAREIVCAATGTARELMDVYAAREPHPHVTADEQRLAARFESAVHGVAQLLHDLPDLLWDETLDLITNGYSDRACAIVLDLHGHITASLDRFRPSAIAAD